MWQDKNTLPQNQPDSPMKEMARSLFTASEKETPEQREAPPVRIAPEPAIRPVMPRRPDLPAVKDTVTTVKQEPAAEPPATMPLPAPPAPSPTIREVKPVTWQQAQTRIQTLPTSRAQKPIRSQTLEAGRQLAAQYLPLPRELQLKQNKQHRTWLLAQVANCQNIAELTDFAYSLSASDLTSIFPTLATLKQGEMIDKLLHIIVLRASKYLYIQGWITLQYAYPRSTVQTGLGLLCEVLEDQKKAPEGKLREAEYEQTRPPLHLGTDHFDWWTVHLISEISLPNNRHFLATIVKYIQDNALEGADFFRQYGIYRDLPLGQAINNQWEMVKFENDLHAMPKLNHLFQEG